MDLPILYKTNEKGQILYWECRIDGDTFFTRAGVYKNRDTHKWKEHKRQERYTPGHGGYRTAEEVAKEHGLSAWKEKKRNDSMVESMEEIENLDCSKYNVPISPVLAHKYKDMLMRHNKYMSALEQGIKPRTQYKFPEYQYWVQPKLDGERCTASWTMEMDADGNPIGESGVHLFSRLRNEIPHLDHIKKILTKIYTVFEKILHGIKTYHFDGELVEPGKTRNSMRSAVSTYKTKHVNNEKVVYYIFDIVVTASIPFSERYGLLEKIFSKIKSDVIQLVPIIHKIHLGTNEIEDALTKTVEAGYEGIILRDPNMLYPTTGKTRSKTMLKHKPLQDKEYRIISAIEGTDTHKGLIVFQVQDLQVDYIKFYVTPAWTHEERKIAWELYNNNPQEYIGKLATILYVSTNEFGTPVEPRMKNIRNASDMDTSNGNISNDYNSDDD